MFDGGLGVFVVQFFTAAILILAANTAYQDFPRLSSILARDRFMPSQFMNAATDSCSRTASWCSRRLVAPDLRLRCEPDPSHPAVRDRGVHLVHALADRHGVALATAAQGGVGARGWRRSIVINWSARR